MTIAVLAEQLRDLSAAHERAEAADAVVVITTGGAPLHLVGRGRR